MLPNAHEDEWDPGVALRGALEGMPLHPEPSRDGQMARLRPLVEEALGALGRLERGRGLSGAELARKEALEGLLGELLGELLAASGPDGPGG